MNPSTEFVVVLRNNANAPDQRANDLRIEEVPSERQKHTVLFILLVEG